MGSFESAFTEKSTVITPWLPTNILFDTYHLIRVDYI